MAHQAEGIGDRYHQETKYRRGEMPRGGFHGENQPSPYEKDAPLVKRFSLTPPALEGGKSLWEAISKRRSFREFSNRPLSLSELSQLVWATQGVTARAWGHEFRAAPSAGALYPIETYILVNRVEGISAGVYHYEVKGAQLDLLKGGNLGPSLSRAGLGQELLETAAAVFVWTAVVERSKWKYRERGYRYIYMDVGHIGQNLYLAASALNLGCCTVGAFFDEEVDAIVGVNGREEISVYMGAVGKTG